MGVLKKRGKGNGETAVVQTAGREYPFAELDRYVPLATPQLRLYRMLKESVPILDAAIGKLVHLVGGFREAEKRLDSFLNTVQVGPCSRGIEAFVAQHLEGLLTYGTSVGEMVLTPSRRRIAALYHAPLEQLELKRGKSPLEAVLCRRQGGQRVPVSMPQLILLSVLSPQPGRLEGTSLLQGLPFVSGILLKIFHTTGVNFERVGNLRFAVTYKPSGDPAERVYMKDRAKQIAGEWARAMQNGSNGRVSDFVAVGDVNIRVIGADNQVLDTEVPVRQMLEQIVAKTGVPPFLLGLSWSSTERMSAQQADLLTSELEAYRRLLTPVIARVCSLWLGLNGYGEYTPRVVWDNINLQDEVELAKAQLLRMQAAQIEEKLTGRNSQ